MATALLVAAAALLGSAHAGELYLGPTTMTGGLNAQLGVRGGGALELVPGARLCAGGTLFADRGDADLTNFYDFVGQDTGISDSKTQMTYDLALAIEPFRGRVGPLGAAFGFYGGLGAVHTSDSYLDLEPDSGDDEYESTRDQTLPTAVWGFTGDVYLNDRLGARVRWHRHQYIEGEQGHLTLMKNVETVSLEAIWVFGEAARKPLEGGQ